VFESLDQVREISAEWMREYNEERPHDTLDGMPPTNFWVCMTAGSSPLILSP
jgi:putative transposase